MAIASKQQRRGMLGSLLTIGVLIAMTGGPAIAGEVTEGQILQALTPKKPLTRSLSMAPPRETATSPTDARFIDTVRNRATTRSAKALRLLARGSSTRRSSPRPRSVTTARRSATWARSAASPHVVWSTRP